MIDLNDRDQVTNRVKELQAQNLPHMTIDKMIELYSDFESQVTDCTDDEKKAINEELNSYLGQRLNYCIISEQPPCFTWGLAHGTLIDQVTGLQWVKYHYFNVGGKERKFVYTLQYHPDCYEVDEE